jgi:hypothetical protein
MLVTGARAEGQSCASAADCAAGSTCIAANNLCPGTCLALLEKGQACSFNPGSPVCDFAAGVSCNAGKCRSQAPGGTPCDNANDCVSLACSDAGVCFGFADAGEACSWLGTPQTPPCGAGLWCDNRLSPGHCQLLGGVGAACFGNADCQMQLRCGPSSDAGFGMGRCTMPLPLGAPCGQQTTLDCASNLFCSNADGGGYACASLLMQGAPCQTFFSHCASGFSCASPDGGQAVCLKTSCFGQSCGDGVNTCGAGACTAGMCEASPPKTDNTCTPP